MKLYDYYINNHVTCDFASGTFCRIRLFKNPNSLRVMNKCCYFLFSTIKIKKF